MKYLCDTCILIDYLRGKETMKNLLDKIRPLGLGMSSVTFMELMVGSRNKHEILLIKKTFADFEIVEINEQISVKAKNLVERFAKSHGLLIPDALIAATALETQLPLFTQNVSDFRFIPNLILTSDIDF